MAWPPSPSSSFLTTNSTIQWGTDGIMTTGTSGTGTSYIVKRIHSADNQEVIYIPNGTGLNAIRIQLFQGRNVEIVIVAQSGFIRPAPETALVVTDPLSGTLMTFHTTANAFEATRKAEGERSISAVFDTLIEGGGTVPVQGTPNAQ